MGERLCDEFADRMAFAGRQHIVVGLVLLKDQPHPFDVVTRMSPVSLGIEIAEEQPACSPYLSAATARVILRVTKVSPRIGLSWLNNAIRGMYAVSFSVIYCDPIA